MRFIEDEDELEAKKMALDDLVQMCEAVIGKAGAEKRRKKKGDDEAMLSMMPKKSSKALLIAEGGSDEEELSEEEMRKLKELYQKMMG